MQLLGCSTGCRNGDAHPVRSSVSRTVAQPRRTRDSLSAADISVLDRTALPDWNGQVIEYVVIVSARDGEDAIARVRDVVSRGGPYSEFAPDPA